MIDLDHLHTVLGRKSKQSGAGRCIDAFLSQKESLTSRERRYRVYVPEGYDGTRAWPLVMVLHGCQQTHVDIQQISGFDAIADREQCILVYPFVTSYSELRMENCWGWWLDRHRQRNQGEVGDLHQILDAVIRDYAIDTARLHVCGLSAGGAMSVVCMATYSDRWTSGASVAGLPYGESPSAVGGAVGAAARMQPAQLLNSRLSEALVSSPPGLLVIQSASDNLVAECVGQSLFQTWKTAIEESQMGTVDGNGLSLKSDDGESNEVSWRFDQFRSGKNSNELAYFLAHGPQHGWMGGNSGPHGQQQGPNISELIWAYFKQPSSRS